MRADGTWFATALLGLALVLGTRAPATAAAEQPALSLSADGVRWSAWLDRPLVRPEQRWVPGDSTAMTLWARNLSTSEARLEVQLVDDDRRFGDDLQVVAEVGGRRVVMQPGRTHRLAPLTGPTRIDLRVTLSREATNRVQQLRAVLSLRVALVADGAAAAGGAARPAELSEPLAGRLPGGTPPFGLPLTVVAIAVAVRAAHVALGRRHSQEVVS